MEELEVEGARRGVVDADGGPDEPIDTAALCEDPRQTLESWLRTTNGKS
ncbi:hypothetical protein [Nocardia sp. CS682]|nr:hypothetical protein [Nocardia sp. CS682]